jgi:hypothetical protein
MIIVEATAEETQSVYFGVFSSSPDFEVAVLLSATHK